MQLGKLDSYVRFERKQVTKDPDFGDEVIAWTEYCKAWVRIDDITTRMQESTNTDLRLLKQPCRVTARYDKNIDASMRLVVLDSDNKILQIVSQPAELGRGEGIEFMAENYSV